MEQGCEKCEKWVYLLTGLMYIPKAVFTDTDIKSTDNMREISLDRIDIRLRRVCLIQKDKVTKARLQDERADRFVFYIGDGIRDDNMAQVFADAVMSALALVYNVATDEIPAAIGFKEELIRKGGYVRRSDLICTEHQEVETIIMLSHCIGVPKEVLEYVWNIVPVIAENEPLMDATHFYRESVMQVWVSGGDISDIVCDGSDLPRSQAEKARIETAYQNSFKAIEAIIGEPSKDERKLRMRLCEAGINPDEKVGYELYSMALGKEIVINKLMHMHETRDRKAAHGKTRTPRVIGYCELRDKQELARFILLTHINFRLQHKN